MDLNIKKKKYHKERVSRGVSLPVRTFRRCSLLASRLRLWYTVVPLMLCSRLWILVVRALFGGTIRRECSGGFRWLICSVWLVVSIKSEMMMKDGIPSVTPVCFGGYGASSFQFSGVKSRGGINGRRKDAWSLLG
ncbi:hypothetical protein YC2023_078955 [Brassica napus]